MPEIRESIGPEGLPSQRPEKAKTKPREEKTQKAAFAAMQSQAASGPIKKAEVQQTSDLPDEVLSLIFSLLPREDLLSVQKASTLFRTLSAESIHHLNLNKPNLELTPEVLQKLLQHFLLLTSLELPENTTDELLDILMKSPCCANLESLKIAKCSKISDAKVSALLKKCRALKHLDASYTEIGPLSIKTLTERCKGLESLNLDSCRNIPEFSSLQKLPLLETLILSRTGIDHVALMRVLEQCRNIKKLDLESCQEIADVGLREIATLADLRDLNIASTLITHPSLLDIVQNCQKLSVCNLALCVNLDQKSFLELARCGQMEDLILGFTNTDNAALNAIATNCPKLRVLDVNSCANITNFLPIAGCALLQELHVRDTDFNGAAMGRILEGCPQLRLLDCRQCKGVLPAEIKAAKEKRPDLFFVTKKSAKSL